MILPEWYGEWRRELYSRGNGKEELKGPKGQPIPLPNKDQLAGAFQAVIDVNGDPSCRESVQAALGRPLDDVLFEKILTAYRNVCARQRVRVPAAPPAQRVNRTT